MKQLYLLFLFLILVSLETIAQDIITKTDNTEIKAKVLEINPTELRYKKFDYQDGPTMVLPIVEVKSIKYSNGSIENYNTTASANNKKSSNKIKVLSIVYDITYPNQKPKIKSTCFTKAVILIHGSKSVNKTFTEYDDISTALTYDCYETIFSSTSDLPDVLIKGDRNAGKRVFESAKIPFPKITVTGESKEILGYTCKKVLTEQTLFGNTTKNYSYIFDGANNYYCFNDFSFDGGIKGLMLGKEIDFSEGAIQVWNAKSITEEMVDSSVFSIPSNYEIMSSEEFTKKVMNDKSLRKKMTEFTPEAKKQMRKELWNDLAKMFIEAAVQATQQYVAAQEYQKNPNSETFKIYANVVINNTTKDPNEAIKANQNLINTITTNNGGNGSTVESSATTNGGNSSNAQQVAICAKQSNKQWENSTEYLNYIKNQMCNKMGYISQRKMAQITLENCRQLLPQSEIDGIEKTISLLTQQINGMPDCQIINFEPGTQQKPNITIVPTSPPDKNNNSVKGAVKAQ